MPSEDDALIINRFKASCTPLLNRFCWRVRFANAWDWPRLYLADLDAIGGGPPWSGFIARSWLRAYTYGSMPASVMSIAGSPARVRPVFMHDHRGTRDAPGPA